MNRAYRYRIYPDKEQEVLLSKSFGCVREMVMLLGTLKLKHYEFLIQHRELPVLNGCRVDVRHLGLPLGAVDVEASKKLVFLFFYGNHNYSQFLKIRRRS